ncbi:hypothetical protein BGX27_007563 [Mortierella sp. AM989]|nr:hypothetical protein BGX27_007563 [Mortierella sp. AM989]
MGLSNWPQGPSVSNHSRAEAMIIYVREYIEQVNLELSVAKSARKTRNNEEKAVALSDGSGSSSTHRYGDSQVDFSPDYYKHPIAAFVELLETRPQAGGSSAMDLDSPTHSCEPSDQLTSVPEFQPNFKPQFEPHSMEHLIVKQAHNRRQPKRSGSDAGLNSEQGESQETTRHDPLNLLLTGSMGTLIIRNLCAPVLNGKIDSRGRPLIKEESIANDAYVQLRKTPSQFQASQHERYFIVGCPGRCSGGSFYRSKKSLQETIEYHRRKKLDEKEAEKEDKERFALGFIQEWRVYYQALPSTARPLFCPYTGFKDVFVLIQERALPPILWGETKKIPNPAVPAATKIMTQGDANALVEHHYGALISRLFMVINNPSRTQGLFITSHGKHMTTMESLSTNSPDKFSKVALQGYLDKSRYIVNNVLSNNGKQAHVVAFDTKTPYRLKNFNSMRRIEKRFPDKDSVLQLFKKNGSLVNTCGVDPGEANTAAFCHVLTKRPIMTSDLNPGCPKAMAGVEEDDGRECGAAVKESSQVMSLVVHRAALYAPILFLQKVYIIYVLCYMRQCCHIAEKWKPEIAKDPCNPRQHIEGQLWINKDVDMDAKTGLPSVKETESELLPNDYATIEELATALKQ